MPDLSKRRPAYRIALLGLMLSLALVLSFFESMLPALPFLPVGVKLGLSNIVTMYCLFFLGAKPALAIAVLKSLFVLLTRGPTGAAMSVAGGLLSVAVMLCCRRVLSLGGRLTSIMGALAHNVGQLVMASLLLRSVFAFYYLPVMILSGVLMGVLTGLLLRFVMPYLQKADEAFK